MKKQNNKYFISNIKIKKYVMAMLYSYFIELPIALIELRTDWYIADIIIISSLRAWVVC